jgi:hypothetical protein
MPTHEEEEVVVLMRVLSHEVNYGYEAPVVFMVRAVQVGASAASHSVYCSHTGADALFRFPNARERR